jgi:hypothetical protein
MLGEYLSCPKLFYYRSFLGLQLPQPQRHLKFGTAIHAAIDNVYEQMDKDTLWDNAEFNCVKRTFEDNWTIHCISDDDFKTKEEKEKCYQEMYDDGIAMLKSYWNKKEILLAEGIDIKESEVIVKVPIENIETGEVLAVPLSCRLDGITSTEGIAELKTSSTKYDEIQTAQMPQALAYPYAYWKKYGKIPKFLYYIILRKKLQKEDRIQVIKIIPTEQTLLEFYHLVDVVLQKIANREFSKSANHPRFCDCSRYETALNVN